MSKRGEEAFSQNLLVPLEIGRETKGEGFKALLC